MKVDGKELFVHTCEVAAFTQFSFSGKVPVEIFPSHDVKRVDIRPAHAGIRPVLEDNVICFDLDEPCFLSVELNGEPVRPLYLFADAPETDVPDSSDAGVRFFRAGRIHEAGEIKLMSGERVYVEGGAVLRGNIVAEDAKNIRVSGRGIIDGSVFRNAERKKRIIDLLHCEDVAIEGVLILDSQTWTIVPQFCRNVQIRGIKQVNWQFGSDGVDIVGSSGIVVDGCFLRNNDDCIAVKTWGGREKYPRESVKGPDVFDVRVSHSVFWNMAWGNALEIGFELRADRIHGISFIDCDIIHVERGAAFSIHNGDDAAVEDVRFENIRVEDCRHKLIDLAVFQSQYSVDRPQDPEERRRRYMNGAWDGVLRVPPNEREQASRHRGFIRNVVFRDITVTDGPFPFSIVSGFDPEHAVENVIVEDLAILGTKIRDAAQGRFFVEHTKNIQFK
ncbi:hypothetical protein JW906_11920 [bacterium]|nr:hypothetical protein [bacterium]